MEGERSMKMFAEKVKDGRVALGLSQSQLAETVGVSTRTIQTYEQGAKMPRATTIHKLAKALKVSVKFLSDETCEDPIADIEKDAYIEEARNLYGHKGAKDVATLLQENAALFAGGELTQEQKDDYFEAIMRCYLTSKEVAKQKFGRK